MVFVVETAPTLEAVEERLSAAVATLQRSPLERVNVLVGSNLQRVYFRRRIAAQLDYSANVRFLTPVELAGAIRDQASLPPRQPLPEGAEPILLDGILRDLRREGAVRRLDPRVQGVAASVAGSLRDLREAALGTEEYRGLLTSGDDRKLHELAAIYERFLERIRPFRERTGTYLDALDPLVPDEAVARAGAKLQDLVTMTVWIIDSRHGNEFTEIRKAYFPDGFAMITCAGFAQPEMMVEIQGIAMIDG